MEKETIVEKVRKLLALGGSSNENEAQSAILMAQKLMAKHNLEMADVELAEPVTKEVVEEMLETTMAASWKVELAQIIAKNFKCELFFRGRGRSQHAVFMGLKEDAQICKDVFQFAYKASDLGSHKYSSYCYRNGLSTNGVKGDYRIGFNRGLRDKFEEQKKANPGWALVLVQDPVVKEKFDSITFTGKLSVGRTNVQGNSAARNLGYSDGFNFGYEKQVK